MPFDFLFTQTHRGKTSATILLKDTSIYIPLKERFWLTFFSFGNSEYEVYDNLAIIEPIAS